MRIADIKVGETYTYRPWKRSTPTKVNVLETGVERTDGYPSWHSGGRTAKNGVRVRLPNGNEAVVASRQIGETWAAFEQEQQRRQEARRRAEEEKAKTRAHRAHRAKILDEALARHGVEARQVTVFGGWDTLAPLEAVGFEVGDRAQPGSGVRSRISSLDRLIRSGQVDLADIEPLLADTRAAAEVVA